MVSSFLIFWDMRSETQKRPNVDNRLGSQRIEVSSNMLARSPLRIASGLGSHSKKYSALQQNSPRLQSKQTLQHVSTTTSRINHLCLTIVRRIKTSSILNWWTFEQPTTSAWLHPLWITHDFWSIHIPKTPTRHIQWSFQKWIYFPSKLLSNLNL